MIAYTSTKIHAITDLTIGGKPAKESQLLDDRGYGRWHCGVFYFTNPKVCSTSIGVIIDGEEYGTSEISYDPSVHKKTMMIIREPISRWISGTIEFLTKFDVSLDDFVHDKIFDIGYDRHTAPQAWFLPYNVKFEELTLYRWSPTILVDLKVKGYFPKADMIPVLNASNSERKMDLLPKIMNVLETTDLKLRLADYYRRDFEYYKLARSLTPIPPSPLEILS